MKVETKKRKLRGIRLLPESALSDTGASAGAKTYYAWPRSSWAIARLRDMLSESGIEPDDRRMRQMETAGSGTIENVYRIPETFLPMIASDPDSAGNIILFVSEGESELPRRYDPKAKRTVLQKGVGTVELVEKGTKRAR